MLLIPHSLVSAVGHQLDTITVLSQVVLWSPPQCVTHARCSISNGYFGFIYEHLASKFSGFFGGESGFEDGKVTELIIVLLY